MTPGFDSEVPHWRQSRRSVRAPASLKIGKRVAEATASAVLKKADPQKAR